MLSASRVISHLAVLTAAVISALSLVIELRPVPESLPTLVILSSCALAVAVSWLPRLAIPGIGFLLCSAPALGGGALSLLLAGWIVGIRSRLLFSELSKSRYLPGHPSEEQLGRKLDSIRIAFWAYLSVILLSASLVFSKTFDSLLYQGILKEGGLAAVLRYLFSIYPSYREIPTIVSANLLTVLFVESFVALRIYLLSKSSSNFSLKSFISGLTLGALFAVGILVLQLLELHPIFSMNLSSFWLLVKRYPASFSDPNSFGVMTTIVVPLLFGAGVIYRNRLSTVSAFLLLAAIPFSGSRSAWVALVLLGLYFLFSNFGHLSRFYRGLSLSLIFMGITAAAILQNDSARNSALSLPLPTGVKRIVELVNVNHARENILSREVFGRLAIEVWRRSPVFGVGLREFYTAQVPAAKRLGIDLGGWRDNANNFYLQVLCESGLAGFFVVLLVFVLLRQGLQAQLFKETYSESACPKDELAEMQIRDLVRLILVVFAILLITGPHIYFDEVRNLIACLCVLGVTCKNFSSVGPDGLGGDCLLASRFNRFGLAVILSLLLGSSGLVLKRLIAPGGRGASGFYGIEQSPEGEQRWSARLARFSICSNFSDKRVLSVNPLRPGLDNSPVEIKISLLEHGKRTELVTETLREAKWFDFHLNVAESKIASSGRRVRYEISTSPVWSPKERGGEDPRWLGVMVRWPQGVCGYR